MKLMTRETAERFRKLGRQEARGNEAIVVCKFFTPDSSWTWFATYAVHGIKGLMPRVELCRAV